MSEQRTIPFDVHIPNVHGTGVAETITIQVPVVRDINSGEDLLTQGAHFKIEQTKFWRVMELYMQLGKENEEIKEAASNASKQMREAAINISNLIHELKKAREIISEFIDKPNA